MLMANLLNSLLAYNNPLFGPCQKACLEPEVFDEAQSTTEITLPSSREPSIQGAADASSERNGQGLH